MKQARNYKFNPKDLRKKVLDMAMSGSTVHIACAFSIIEILAVLYREILRYPNNDPNSEKRDFFVLSKGHGVMAQYACMHELGWINDTEISEYFSNGTRLKGLSDSQVAGLEVTSGSLGHGLSIGVGIALAAKRDSSDQNVFVLLGDGELNEGTNWEAMMLASHHHLNNLCAIVDANGLQAMGPTDEIISMKSLSEKFRSFGFETLEVDGHCETEIRQGFDKFLQKNTNCPTAIIAKTVKGKGIAFMENNNVWHYTRLDTQTYKSGSDMLTGREAPNEK